MRSKETRSGGQGSHAIAIRQPMWNLVQNVLGCPYFISKLYRSVLRPPGRLLDFGCANGDIAEVFLEFNYY